MKKEKRKHTEINKIERKEINEKENKWEIMKWVRQAERTKQRMDRYK